MADDLEPLLRYWREQDDRFARVDEHWWGAVVSDARYPRLQEPNYARVETRQAVTLAEVEAELLPRVRETAGGRSHVVIFFAEDQTELLVAASSRGERLAWDLVMEHTGEPPPHDDRVAETTIDDPAFAATHLASMAWFDVTDPATAEEIVAMEREVFVPAGRRWFVVRGPDGVDALAAVIVLNGVGYVDHVATAPHARRRGHARALVARAVAAARDDGAERTYLLAEPGGDPERLYARLGFRDVTRIASWITEPPDP